MKKSLLAIIGVLLLSMTAPLLAEEMSNKAHMGTEKDQCLLYSKKCRDNVDSLQERIKKLDNEIAKGTTTYNPEEIKRLDEKMKEANQLLDTILSKP